MLKIAVFAPKPSASERTETAANLGLLRKIRRSWRTSRPHASSPGILFNVEREVSGHLFA
jgi:hypothetical protein